MKKWNKIIEKNKFQEYFKHILEFRGYHVYDVEHSVERYHERVGKDIFIYNKLLKKGINWIINNGKEKIEERYIFVSKKYGFGIQIEWRKDRKSGEFAGFTATTLSNEEMKYFTHQDKEIFLENLKEQGLSSDEGLYVIRKGYGRYKFQEGLENELKICGYDKFIQDNTIYYTCEIVEV